MIRSIRFFIAVLAILTAYLPATADVVSWMDFSLWDHAAVTGAGQTFENISDGADVLVTGTPGHSRTSLVDAEGAIRTGGEHNTHSFTFSFSAPVPVVVSVDSLDRWETIHLMNSGGGAVGYTHYQGSTPTAAGNLILTGTGVGQDSTSGAAQGLLNLGTTTSFTWEYTADFGNKFERFMVGQLVPEPGSMSLVWLSGLPLLGGRRRR